MQRPYQPPFSSALAYRSPEKSKLLLSQQVLSSLSHSVRSIRKGQIKLDEIKDILKNQIFYMQVQFKGKIFESQYNEVVKLMGGQITKKLTSKVTIILSNSRKQQFMNRAQKLNVPIVSVLWVDACLKQRKKLDYAEYLIMKQETKHKKQKSIKNDQQFTISVDFLTTAKDIFLQQEKQFIQRNHLKDWIRYIKDNPKNNRNIDHRYINIKAQEIDLGPQQRKSDRVFKNRKNINNERAQKNKRLSDCSDKKLQKNLNNKKTLSPVIENVNQQHAEKNNIQDIEFEYEDKEDYKKNYTMQTDEILKQNKSTEFYEKYLQNVKFEDMENQNDSQKLRLLLKNKIQVESNFQTPMFSVPLTSENEIDTYKKQLQFSNDHVYGTPPVQRSKSFINLYGKTQSIKQLKNSISNKLNIYFHDPFVYAQISKLIHLHKNLRFRLVFCPVFEQNDEFKSSNSSVYIFAESKIDRILAVLSNAQITISLKNFTIYIIPLLIDKLQADVQQSLINKNQTISLNKNLIKNKNITIFDSSYLSILCFIIEKLQGTYISKQKYLLHRCDILITNRKMCTSKGKLQERTMTEYQFIQMLLL